MFNEAAILAGSLFGAVMLLGLWVVKLLNGDEDGRRVEDLVFEHLDFGGARALGSQ